MAKFYQKNNLQLGISIGLILPIIFYFIFMGIYMLLENNGILQHNLSDEFSERTIALLALAVDIVPMRYYQKKKFWVNTMRGVTIAMSGLAFVWMVYYIPGLFS